ncbi:MAG: peptidase [Frankiales bacterium]|nr:peptidase [Frankiales bacterium]
MDAASPALDPTLDPTLDPGAPLTDGWLRDRRDSTGAGAVVTYGGGGLSAGRTGFSAVERALLAGVRGSGRRPRVTLVPTASGDDDACMDAFRAACDAEDAEGHVLSLFRRTEAPFGNVLDDADLVYVTGGAVANLAALWRLHGLAAEVVGAWRRGAVVAGSSAGALIWSLGGVTTSFGTPAGWTDGLGVVPHSLCPHYDTQPGRAQLYRDLVDRGELPAGYGLDEDAAGVFVGGELVGVLADREGAGVHAVSPTPAAGRRP